MNKIFAQLIRQRQLDDDFLHPRYENLESPDSLPDMKQAILRIKRAIDNGETIIIYGDYDVDGITASALIEETLKLAGLPPEHIAIMLPNRFKDGYGMSPRLVRYAKELKAGLVITVDCGSNNHEIIQKLKKLGIDTIVTDHHECSTTLPPAVAIINPKRADYLGPATLRELSGAGVAFKLASGLTNVGLIPRGQEKWLLDLVLIGTICDNMLLTGENRILCYYGLKVLAKTRRIGLKELMRCAGVKTLSSDSIGFQLGPRLNAAGRLESAETALDLLRATNRAEAAALALKLEELNKRRRSEQESATAEIIAHGTSTDQVIVEVGKWHEGVLGIVAGQLVERYHKPAFVLTPTENGDLKGSGRSFGDFNLALALQAVSDFTIGGGGHAGAAGVRLSMEQLTNFRAKINRYYRNLHLPDQEPFFRTQPDISLTGLKDISLELLDSLKSLEPFGAGNENPAFLIKKPQIVFQKNMGSQGQHLCLDIEGADGGALKLVAFNAPETWHRLCPSLEYDFLFRPMENEWNGTRSVEARLLDLYVTS